MRPTTNLRFGRNVNNMPVATFIQLNSMDVVTNTIYPAYPAYPSGYDNPYPAYQTFEPVRHPNIGHRAPHQNQDNNAHQQQLMHQQQLLLQQQQQQQLLLQQQQQQQLAQQQQEALVPLNPNNQQVPVHAPPIFGALPQLAIPPSVPGLAGQHTAKQKLRVDPHLLEDAAARQQAIAEGKVAPQRTVINPDADWLQGLPHAMREMRASDPYQTPRTSPEMTPILSPVRKETSGMPMHATGDQSLWDIPDLPAPTRTMDFHELPTDTPMVVQNQRRLAKVGNEIVRVKNHPEDYLPGMMKKFEAMALQQKKESGARSKRQSKDRDTDERSTTPRRSSRTKKPTEHYQAGLNSMQASSNPRGYVDSSSRYRSYSRDRLPRDQSGQRSPSRQDRYSRQPSRDPNSRQGRYSRQPSRDSNSRQDRYSRQPSRDPSRSRYYQRTPSRGQSGSQFRTPLGDRNRQRSTYRPQSKSPHRTKSPGYNSDTRQSRAPYRTDRSERNSSMSTRNTYTLMKRGVNCKPSYDPAKMKYCTKCMKNDHHEFECARYYTYNENKCSFCHKMYHLSQECKEIKEFPPGVTSKN